MGGFFRRGADTADIVQVRTLAHVNAGLRPSGQALALLTGKCRMTNWRIVARAGVCKKHGPISRPEGPLGVKGQFALRTIVYQCRAANLEDMAEVLRLQYGISTTKSTVSRCLKFIRISLQARA